MKNLFFIFFVLLFTLAIHPAKAQDKPNSTNSSEIKFTYQDYNYGTIIKGANGDCEFRFTNTGNEPLIITNCQGSCGCTVPTWTKEPVMPGKEGVIKVTYNTNRVGSFDKNVTVSSNAKNSPVILHIKGIVQEVPGNNGPIKPSMNGGAPFAR